jgi:hypothetical protein
MRKVREARQVLTRHGIKHCTANDGVHLMITQDCRRIDFWPTTGKWIARGFRDVQGKGIDELLAYMEVQRCA